MANGLRVPGNFAAITSTLLSKFPDEDGKASYTYDMYVFHIIKERGLTYLCMTDCDAARTKIRARDGAPHVRLLGIEQVKHRHGVVAVAERAYGDFKASCDSRE